MEGSKDALRKYDEVAKNPGSHSLFELVDLLGKIEKEQAKLTEEELDIRARQGNTKRGKTVCYLEMRADMILRLMLARKDLERIIEEVENERG